MNINILIHVLMTQGWPEMYRHNSPVGIVMAPVVQLWRRNLNGDGFFTSPMGVASRGWSQLGPFDLSWTLCSPKTSLMQSQLAMSHHTHALPTLF